VNARLVAWRARLAACLRWAALAIPFVLLGVGAPASAQQTPSLQAAVMQLAQTTAGPPAIAPLPQTTLSAGASCSWCSSSFIGICFKHDSENWGQTLNMDWHAQLDQAEAQSAAIGARIGLGADAARAWMNALPAFSARFDSAADIVLGVQAEMANAPSTPEQRARATGALQQLTSMVAASASQLEDAARTLAAVLQQQSGYRDDIAAALADSLRSSQDALTAFENGARTHRCQDGVDGQLAAARASVNASQDAARARVAWLSRQSSDTERSLAALLGAVVNARGNLENVLRLVQAASNDQVGSFLAQLHLSAAKRQWQDLAATAGTAGVRSDIQTRALP